MAKNVPQEQPAFEELPPLPDKLPHTFTAQQARSLIAAGIRAHYGVAVEWTDVTPMIYEQRDEAAELEGVKVLMPFAARIEYA